jgi:DeoR/GlpR family transcriptional regulator of sugar metabolism
VAVNSSLDAEARRRSLLEQLAIAGSLKLTETASACDVHPMTIRRDFDLFVARGLARRVRGGVIAVGGEDFEHRSHRNASAKRAIAVKLRDLLEPGAVIGLDSSTTIGVFAEAIHDVADLTVVTNGLRAFESLHGRAGVRAYLTGGEQEDENEALVGSLAEDAVSRFAIDVAFVSSMSLDPDFGTSEPTLAQVAFKRALVASARLIVVAVDVTKLATKSRFRSLPLTDRVVLVTELDSSDPRLDPYRGTVAGIR